MIKNVLRARRAFRNWPEICVVVGVAAPSGLPPRGGWPWLGRRRQQFVTRSGLALETEAGNSSPIIEVFAYGEYDLPLKWSELRRVIDVGAHVGSFALWTCDRAPEARIVAVEPEPHNFHDLVANVERNGQADRVEAVHAALGSDPGTVTLRVPMNRESGSMFAADGDSIHAAVITLPDLIARFEEPPDLLKLDCEGAEWQVLEGLEAVSWACISRLIMECHATAGRTIEEMTDLLSRHGLSVTIRSRSPSGVPWCEEVAMIWADREPISP